MQQGPRMAMASNPHMQHPGMNQPMDPATMQQQVAAMNAAGVNGNGGEYGGQNMSDQARAYLEQQMRMQQQHQQQQQGRDGKAAAQRALGVGAQPQNQQQIIQQQQMIMQQQGIRQITTANGQIYVDSQGRQVQLPAGWQPMNDPRQPPAGMVSQAQLQAFYQQQQQQQQQQQAHQHPQQHPQQHHVQQQQHMLPPQQALHYQRQQQLAQQQAQQAQQQQQRGSQPPSARPPHAVPPQIPPGQSPALLQVPPPPIKRTVSRAASRSASPIPPHIRPPSAMAQPMQASTSAIDTTGTAPTILPLRSATVPATNGEGAQNQFADNAIPPQSSSIVSKATDSKFAQLQSNRLNRPQNISSAARVRRYEEKTVRLQRMIDKAQEALIAAEKEAENAKKAKDKVGVDEDPQIGFDRALLDYFDISKIHPSRKSTLDGSSTADVTLVNSAEAAKSSKNTPDKAGSSDKDPQSANTVQSQSSNHGKSSPKSDRTPTDSIFDPDKGQSSSPEKMNVDQVKQEGAPNEKVESGEQSAPHSASSSNLDLGDLYTWWVVFQDSKRISARRNASKTIASQPNTAITTGITPSSAIAARIAVANPAAAVRAASVDFAGQRGQAGVSQQSIQDDVPVTATLQQMEALKKEQNAKIQADQEVARRRAEMQGGMQDGRQMVYQNGQPQAMTQEQIQSIYQQQQQLHAQQHHLQPQNTGLAFPPQPHQMYQQVSTPGGTIRNLPPQMMMQQNGMNGSPINGSPQTQKRGAEASPVDHQGAKKPKMVGKQPTPEEHRRQAIELAKSVMPAPGVLQLPGQQRSMSQEMPRPSLEAQRQYSQTQAAYARQQEMAVRQHIANSPAQMTGMSPAQMTPAQMTEASPIGLASPSMQNNGNFGGEMNGLPMSQQQETPTSGNKARKGKPGPGLTVDTDTAAEAPEATPTGVSGKRKASANKKLPKSATEKNNAKGKNVNSKGVKGGRPSTADGTNPQNDDSPTAPTPSQGYGIAQTPTNPTGGEMNYGPGPSSAPGSSRSQVFQLPPVNEPSTMTPVQQHQQVENGVDLSVNVNQPQQQNQTNQAQNQGQPQQVMLQQQPHQQLQQPQQQQQPDQQQGFDTNFGFDDTSDFLKSFDFSGGGMQIPNSADYGSFNFDDFNFTNVGESQDDWTSLDGGMS
ncbi:uncharacterized protein L201_005097 [Kwoniella dendrophila CBS 6074]|uniref:BZIP domain-containing protein n=1 Tax=Kwoniella dendrophila CBS 6074 TaxID=1295534 RepID=A0AAX4JYA6_9TREE